jgi:hypothetical protein
MFLDKGKYYKVKRRNVLVGQVFEQFGNYLYKIIYINSRGYVTGTDELHFDEPCIEIDVIKIRERDRDKVERIMQRKEGRYDQHIIYEKPETIDTYMRSSKGAMPPVNKFYLFHHSRNVIY